MNFMIDSEAVGEIGVGDVMVREEKCTVQVGDG
jgi:hypothetical protein